MNTYKTSSEITLKDFIIGVQEWLLFLLSKWLFISCFGFLGATIGLAYSFWKKPIYTATTVFVLEEDKAGGSSLGSISGLASMAGLDLGAGRGSIFQGDNILELYRSRKMIEKTLLTRVTYDGKKQLLIDRYIEFNNLREGWGEKQDLKNLQFLNESDTSLIEGNGKLTRLKDSIITSIVKAINKSYLSVGKPDKKLSIIRADVSAKDEFFAKEFNENIVKNVNDFYIQTKTKKSLQNVLILQQKTDSIRAVMNGDIYAAAAVTDATPNLNLTRQAQRIAPIQRSQFSAEANKAILTELVKNLELSKIALRRETPLIQVVDVPVYPLEKEKFGKLKGLMVGGVAGGFITVMLLLVIRIFSKIMA